MKVLVTGASGFVGTRLVTALCAKGHEVIALSRSPLSYTNDRLQSIIGDLVNIELLVPNEIQIDAVFHVAANINFDSSQSSIDQMAKDNIVASYLLSEFLKRRKIRRLILSSSCSVYEQTNNVDEIITEFSPLKPWNLYAVSKLASEWVFSSQLDPSYINFVILRYSSIYGAGQKTNSILPIFVNNSLQKKQLEIFGTGKRKQNYVHVDDVANFNLMLLDKTLNFGEVFNVGSSESISDIELAETINRVFGNSAPIKIKGEFAQNKENHLNFSILKAKQILGFNPSNLEEGLLKYFKKMNEFSLHK